MSLRWAWANEYYKILYIPGYGHGSQRLEEAEHIALQITG
jgi:hypothetical protein